MLANLHLAMPGQFTSDPDLRLPAEEILEVLHAAAGAAVHACDFRELARDAVGDPLLTNSVALGYAYQRGLLPVRTEPPHTDSFYFDRLYIYIYKGRQTASNRQASTEPPLPTPPPLAPPDRPTPTPHHPAHPSARPSFLVGRPAVRPPSRPCAARAAARHAFAV